MKQSDTTDTLEEMSIGGEENSTENEKIVGPLNKEEDVVFKTTEEAVVPPEPEAKTPEPPRAEEPTSSMVIPGGVHRRLVGPIANTKVPMLKTYTSSRNITVAVARPSLPERKFEFGVLPFIERHTTLDVKSNDWGCSLDVTEFLPKDEDILSRVGQEKVDLSYLLYGTAKGIVRTARNVGRALIRDKNTKIQVVDGPDWGHVNLVVAPAYAPAFGKITDESLLKSEKLLTSAFVEVPAAVRDLTRVCIHTNELLCRGINPVRFVYRLAVMYVYARFASPSGLDRVSIESPDDPCLINDVSNFARWQELVLKESLRANFVAWLPGRVEVNDRDLRYYAVLSMACSETIRIGVERNYDSIVEPILWPSISNIRIIGGNIVTQYRSNQMITTAGFIYEVGVAWCTRFATLKMFQDAVKIVSMLYFSDGMQNCLLNANRLEIALPEASLGSLILAPLLERTEAGTLLRLSDYHQDGSKMMIESATAALLVSFARNYQQSLLLDRAIEMDLLENEDDYHEALMLITSANTGSEVPIWGPTAYTLKELGIKGDIGRVIRSLSIACLFEEYKKMLLSSMPFAINSFDVVPILRKIPNDCAVAGWLRPKPLVGLETQIYYLFDDWEQFGIVDAMMSLSEVASVIGGATVSSRWDHSVKNYKMDLKYSDARGFQRDFMNLGFTLPDGGQVKYGFKIKSIEAREILLDAKHDRYNLEWFIGSTRNLKRMNIKALDGLLLDPKDQVMNVLAARREYLESREKRKRATKRIIDTMSKNENDTNTNRRKYDDSDDEDKPAQVWKQAASKTYSGASNSRMESGSKQAPKAARVYDTTGMGAVKTNETVGLQNWMSHIDPAHSKMGQYLRNVAFGAEAINFVERLMSIAAVEGSRRSWPETGQHGMSKFDPSLPANVCRLWNHELLMQVEREARSTFCHYTAEVLRLSVGHIWLNHCDKRDVHGLIEGLQVLGNHLAMNPDLSPEYILSTKGDIIGQESYELLKKADGNVADGAKILLSQNDPISALTAARGPDDPRFVKADTSAEPPKMNEHIQAALAAVDMLKSMVATTPSDEMRDAIDNVMNNEYVTQKELNYWVVPAIDELKKLVNSEIARQKCSEEVKHFIPKEDDDSDEDKEAKSGRRKSMRRVVSMRTRMTTRSRGTSKNKSESNAASSEGSGVDQQMCSSVLNWLRNKEFDKHAIFMLTIFKMCPCMLVKVYGGRWPGLTQSTCQMKNLVAYWRYRDWFDHLDLRGKSLFMLLEHYSCAGEEHFQDAFVANLPTDVAIFDLGTYHQRRRQMTEIIKTLEPSSSKIDTMVNMAIAAFYKEKDYSYQSDIARSKMQGGIPIQLTVKMVLMLYPKSKSLVEILHNRSPDSFEYEVATTVFTIMNLPNEIVAEMLCQQWLEVPLNEWYKVFKSFMTRTKRSNMFGYVVGEQCLLLRKFLNTTIRRTGDCDVHSETLIRGGHATPKLYYNMTMEEKSATGMNAQSYYIKRFAEICLEQWKPIVGAMYKAGLAISYSDYWAQRAVNTAGGASTLVKKMDVGGMDGRIMQGDRPGKKVAVEELDDDFLEKLINSTRPMNRANYFTKPEPGMKLRPLYSSYDEETFVASYASQGVENHMWHTKGIMVRQTPMDVLDWMAESENKNGSSVAADQYWLSTDYSDYNAEHTFQEMAMCDYAYALNWFRLGTKTPDDPCTQKAKAAMWVARGYTNSWITWGQRKCDETFKICKTPEGDFVLTDGMQFSSAMSLAEAVEIKSKQRKIKTWTRVINGLYSGSRDTARNNTMIHSVDMAMLQEVMRVNGVHMDIRFFCLCGDDEDVKFTSPLDACIYYNLLEASGHQINPQKQMGGTTHHEFLQIVWSKTARVEKPLCALVSTLTTGNWYIQLGLWIQNIIECCIANFWELYCRGVELWVAQRMCVMYLDRLMFLPKEVCVGTEWETTGKTLEWWSYRMQPNFMPLFADTSGVLATIPKFEAAPDVRKSWPKKATKAFIKYSRNLLDLLPKNYDQEFSEVLQLDTVGSALKSWRQKETKRWCVRHWPERTNEPNLTELVSRNKCVEQPANLGMLRASTPRRKRIDNEAAVYARLGLPLFIGKKLGPVYSLGKMLPHQTWKRATNIYESGFKGNYRYYELQTNLRACISYWQGPHRDYHCVLPSKSSINMNYVFMANGAGKSYLTTNFKLFDDLDELWNDLYGVFRENFEVVNPKSSFTAITHVATDILDRCMKSKGTLLGQLQPVVIQQAIKKGWHGPTINCYYFDPGEEIRRQRMINRQWDPEKVERRLARARDLYKEAEELGWTRLNDVSEILRIGELNSANRSGAMLHVANTYERAKYEYVFDRSEIVTRQLKIKEELDSGVATESSSNRKYEAQKEENCNSKIKEITEEIEPNKAIMKTGICKTSRKRSHWKTKCISEIDALRESELDIKLRKF